MNSFSLSLIHFHFCPEKPTSEKMRDDENWKKNSNSEVKHTIADTAKVLSFLRYDIFE